jgi:oleate hydratase
LKRRPSWAEAWTAAEIPGPGIQCAADACFTVEYSVRAAQMAVYELLGSDRKVPPVTPHAKSLQTEFEAVIKAFK